MEGVEVPTEVLEEIGLTKNEIKVYVALLKIGSSTKKDIVSESGITPSKLYNVADRLQEKGLVSSVKKNGVLHFNAAPPEQVIDFLEAKKRRIDEQEERFEQLIPALKSLEKEEAPETEVYTGWKGMRTAYQMMLRELEEGDTNYVMGATSGQDTEAAKRFFTRIQGQRREKGVALQMLVNREDETWARDIIQPRDTEEIRAMEHVSPTEISIWADHVLTVMLTEQPVVIHTHSSVAAAGFKNYFDKVWKAAGE